MVQKERAMERRIYLDNAATTPLDQEVLEKMLPYYTQAFGNADSLHSFGRNAMSGVDYARDTVAEILGAKPKEIYFTSGGTESDNWAVLGAAAVLKHTEKTHILLSSVEHDAVYMPAMKLKRQGFDVELLPVNAGGMVEENALKERIKPTTGLVCVMTANNETGVVQPVQSLSKIARENGALFFTDAVQGAPYLDIDVGKSGVDMLSLSAHKFYGPKGVGALYIKSGVRIEKLIGGGEQERGLRGGTSNVAAIVGLSAAYQKARTDMEKNEKQLAELSAYFMQQLREKTAKIDGFAGLVLNGEGEEKLPSVCNVRFVGVENTALLFNLDLQGVCVAAGSACASASIKPSHVLTAMGLDERAAKECIRFSFGKENTKAQIDYAVDKIVQTVKQLVKKA